MRRWRALTFGLLLLVARVAGAHEIRPAYLEILEQPDGSVQVTWRKPVAGESALAIQPWLSAGWLDTEPTARTLGPDSLTLVWQVKSPHAPLAGQQVRILGLDRTITDVFLRIRYADGRDTDALIKAARPEYTVDAARAGTHGTVEYLRLGITHIATGFDHLLYLFALLLLIDRLPQLIATVSAFTLAHSITLACAALNLVHLRAAPVEASIALSIAYVAAELVRRQRGQAGLLQGRPWIVALGFGLLHGFGFAGALRDIGLPPGGVASALLAFNVGIELGQLAFVTIVFVLLGLLRRAAPTLDAALRRALPLCIGSIAAFWLIQRITTF
jgi:hypothetical protein